MTDDLVKRLRDGTGDGLRAWDWMREAADRIEELERERDTANAAVATDDEELIRLQEWERRIRREALEEAAKVVDSINSNWPPHIAAAIRALKEKE